MFSYEERMRDFRGRFRFRVPLVTSANPLATTADSLHRGTTLIKAKRLAWWRGSPDIS